MFFAFTALYALLSVTVIVLLRRIAGAPRKGFSKWTMLVFGQISQRWRRWPV